MAKNILNWVKTQHEKKGAQPYQLPSVTLAYAQSIDGCLTLQQGLPTAISGPLSKRFTHQLRAVHDGILVGIGTVLSDDPRLDVRLVEGKNPRPVVLDPDLRLPLTANLIKNQSGLIVFCGETAAVEKRMALTALGVQLQVCEVRDGLINLPDLLSKLSAIGFQHVMVEGGVQVLRSFFTLGLWDLAVVTIAPLWLGGYGGITPPLTSIPLMDVQIETLEGDILMAGKRQ